MDINTIHGLNGYNIEIIMKKMADQACEIIRKEIATFTQEQKINPHKLEDLVTSADYAAQQVTVRMIRENFPFAGIIAEENGLHEDPSSAPYVWFTIDPLDGTKAFARKQSDGIGFLLSMVVEGDIVASVVADIMTGEIYYYRYGSDKVYRESPHRNEELIFTQTKKKRVLLYDDPRLYSKTTQLLTEPHTGYFSSIDVSNGSIGTNMAKLWKGEIQALITKPVTTNPWDWVPVVGICAKMGYVFREIRRNELLPTIYQEKVTFDPQSVGEIICIHQKDVDTLARYLQEAEITV